MWAWGLVDVSTIGTPITVDDVEIDNNIDSFIERLTRHNSTVYFHNLKFDGWFIIDWLLKNGFQHVVSEDRNINPGTFKSLISDMGKFYSITIRWENGHSTELRDSLKKLPMSVKRIAESFKLEQGKGTIDYDAYRPVGHRITEQEAEYLKLDVVIVAQAMQEVIANGMTKLTVASDSLAEYKRLTGDKHFTRLFPVLSDYMDSEIRRAYRGGFTYADDRFSKRLVGQGLVLDVNSLYPSVMKNKALPWGEPEFVDGIVTPTAQRPLTIFSVTFTARIKPDHIPCIQIKGSSMFQGTEYLREISEPTTLMVTNVDWALYNDHYDIEVQAYGGGWRFHAAEGMFDRYIEKWSKIKETETGGKREIAKLHLNSLYGKFASNPNVTSKIPVLHNNAVKLVRGQDETRPPVYTAVGVFITSFARDLTIRAAQANYDVFAYADTDSLHLLASSVPEAIDVHPTRIGAWKLEYHFDNAFYIRPKAYLERTPDGKYINRMAGAPESISRTLTFDDVVGKSSLSLTGKLQPKSVPGGVLLKEIPFDLAL